MIARGCSIGIYVIEEDSRSKCCQIYISCYVAFEPGFEPGDEIGVDVEIAEFKSEMEFPWIVCFVRIVVYSEDEETNFWDRHAVSDSRQNDLLVAIAWVAQRMASALLQIVTRTFKGENSIIYWT